MRWNLGTAAAVARSVVACSPQELLGAEVDGRYTITHLIGRGGFGAVFRADDREGPPVAIKLIPFASWTERVLAQREASRLEEHAHPGLVAFHRTGRFGPTANGYVYIAMELGEASLDEHVRREGPLPAAAIRAILSELLDALDNLHVAGVVHGDVKPGNLVRAGGRWKLCDLGSAAAIGSRADRDGWRSGTPEIAAPEVFDGEIGPAADLWSLGLLVHTCASGRSAFRMPSGDVEAIARFVREASPQLDPALGEPFASIVRGCLQRDPAARWTTAQVREALAARPDTVSERSSRTSVASRVVIALAGGATVAALAWQLFSR